MARGRARHGSAQDQARRLIRHRGFRIILTGWSFPACFFVPRPLPIMPPFSHWISHLRIAVIGFCMGAADLVPGVSGGTVAFVCGIYDRLINGIKACDLTCLRLLLRGRLREVWARVPMVFLVTLGVGLLTAILSLSHVLSALFRSHPVQLWSFFFGLILGSIVLLVRETRPWRPRDVAAFLLAAGGTFWLVGLGALQTPANPLYL